MRRNLLLLLVLVGCGSDDKPATDAAVSSLTCDNYCMAILANCTGANAQYPDMAHCTAACASFPMGTAGDQTGNTLGCRTYHAGAPSMMAPDTHCVHAGPGGDKTSVTAPPGTCGDPCTSFCTLEIKACGLTGDAGGNGQYASMAACLSTCAAFPNSDHAYAVTSKGDSLACRLYHATNAAEPGNAMIHCPHTGPTPAAPPGGGANPCLAGSTASP